MLILLLIGNVKIEPKFRILLKTKVLSIYAKALGFIFIVLFLMFNSPFEDGRPILPGMENPIWLSRIFGTLLIWSFLDKFGFGHGLVDFVYKSILGLIILFIGSRGVIFSVSVVLFVLYWKFVRLSSVRRFYFILMSSTLILFSVYYLYDYTPNPESLYSYYRRLELLGEFRSIELISIFGNGLGSFGPIVIGLDQRNYPHNYFFEYLFEFGVFGLFCALALIMILVIKSKNSFMGYLGFFFLLGSFSSGDIPANSFYYLSIFVLLLKNRFE